MAISHYSSAIYATDWVSGGIKSFSVDCGSGTDRYLIAFVYLDRDMTNDIITAATYNSVSMTAIGSSFYESLLGYEVRVFYLANPASGTNTLSASVGSDSTKCGLISMVYNGVRQDIAPKSPTTRATTISNGSTASFSQTSTSGDTIIWTHLTQDAAGANKFAPGSGFSERLDNFGFSEDIIASGASTTIEWVNNVGSVISYIGLGMGLEPAGGAGGIPKTTRSTLLGIG